MPPCLAQVLPSLVPCSHLISLTMGLPPKCQVPIASLLVHPFYLIPPLFPFHMVMPIFSWNTIRLILCRHFFYLLSFMFPNLRLTSYPSLKSFFLTFFPYHCTFQDLRIGKRISLALETRCGLYKPILDSV